MYVCVRVCLCVCVSFLRIDGNSELVVGLDVESSDWDDNITFLKQM